MPLQFTTGAWHSLRNEWLWVYHGAVPSCDVWSPVIPVPAGVFFVEHGEGRIRADGREIIVSREQAFFSAPGLRQHCFAKGTRLLSAGFRSVWPDGAPLFRHGLNVTAKSPRLRTATAKLFRLMHRGRKTVTYREAIQQTPQDVRNWAGREAAFAEWFVAFIKALDLLGIQPEPRAGSERRRLEQLLTWLNARPLDQTAPNLPPGFPVGMRRADQLLQQHLGIGLRVFLERRRLDAARASVISEHTSLKEIAFTLGFRHASHFTTWFRRHTGMSPSAYRATRGEVA